MILISNTCSQGCSKGYVHGYEWLQGDLFINYQYFYFFRENLLIWIETEWKTKAIFIWSEVFKDRQKYKIIC